MRISFTIHLASWNVLSSRSYTGLLFGILVIGICLSFEICYLEFPLPQLLREWIQETFVLKFHTRFQVLGVRAQELKAER